MISDGDVEMSEWDRLSRSVHQAREAGRCVHATVVFWVEEPRYPEQEGLLPGQFRCTEGCGATFDDEVSWLNAMDDALEG